MTDIRQHLPLILSSVRQHLATNDTPEALRASLRKLLSGSYGIGVGHVVNEQGLQSQALDVIIYDTTIAPTQQFADPSCHDLRQALAPTQQFADPSCHDLRQALAVIVLARELTLSELKTFLQTMASMKMLRPILRQEQKQNVKEDSEAIRKTGTNVKKPTQSIKKLLPLGIVACQHLVDVEDDDPEPLSLTIDGLLKEQAEHLRPDYLIAQSHQLVYSNPLLAGDAFVPSTLNIAREPALKRPHPCYVCKQPFTSAHFFYQHLCLRCGDLNYRKRALPADLTGRIALVTGARVKIGYATALRLLRAGAQVIVTTRFPHDAACRYSSEPDFADWQDRLQIYGLDFRYIPVLERFVAHLHTHYPALDILINNAAQTVRRPLDYYAHLLPLEQAPLATLPPAQQALVRQSHATLPPTPFALSGALLATSLPQHTSIDQVPSATILHEYGTTAFLPQPYDSSHFPANQYDEHQQQLDLRVQNSWTLPFNKIDLTEFLEVQVINVTVPFLLVSQLHPLLCRSPFAQRFIVNVSAIEGQFANAKLGNHVHTNMAKASLNMLTHTASAQLARDNIFMHSVDPGWISHQSPITNDQKWEQLQQLLPLDLIDAAARICDPIFASITMDKAPYGCFYKDYQPTAW